MRAGEIVDTVEQRLRCEHRWRATVDRREWSAWSRLLSDRRRGHQRTHHRLRDQERAGRLRPPGEAGRDLQRGAGRRHPRRRGRSGGRSRDSGAPGLVGHLASHLPSAHACGDRGAFSVGQPGRATARRRPAAVARRGPHCADPPRLRPWPAELDAMAPVGGAGRAVAPRRAAPRGTCRHQGSPRMVRRCAR